MNNQKHHTTPQTLSEESAKDIEKVAKGAGISLIGSVTGRGLWFLCQLIIARFFGAEIFGLYILGLTVLKMTYLLASFGLQTGAMRFVSIYRKDDPSKVKGTIISASLISFFNGILIGGIIYISAGFISILIFDKPELTEIIKNFALCLPFIAAMMVIAEMSKGFHTTKNSVYIKDIIQPGANIAFVLMFILLDFGISGVISAYIISHIIAVFAGYCFIARQFPGIKKKTLKPVYENKKLLIYSTPLMLSGFLIFFISWTDILMLGMLKTSIEVGIYRAASQMPIIFTMILTASNSIYAPTIAEMYHLDQIKRMERIFKTTTRWVFSLTLPVALILIFSAKEVMSIFGPDFIKTGGQVLIVLTIAQFINCITGGVGYTLNMTGKQNVEMVNSIVLVAVNIVLNYFLIPIYGSLGAAVATGVSIVAINFIRLFEVYMFYRIHPYNMEYIQGIVSGMIAVSALFLAGKHLSGYSRLVSNSLITGVIFITFLAITGIRDEDKLFFATLGEKLNMRIFKRLFLQ